MGHVILGLLLMGDQTLYSLKKQFEAGVSLFYSASTGSLKRALDLHLAAGRVRLTGAEGGPRGRKTYTITDAGEAEFRAWILGPITGPDLETAALTRVFFLGTLVPEERVAVLDRIVARAEVALAELRGVAVMLDAQQIPPEFTDVFTHQRATLDYGIGAHEHAVAWFRAHAARTAEAAGG